MSSQQGTVDTHGSYYEKSIKLALEIAIDSEVDYLDGLGDDEPPSACRHARYVGQGRR